MAEQVDAILDFPACGVCGADEWDIVFEGDVRAGVFGASVRARIGRCGTCGVDRLEESRAMGLDAYQSEAYRAFLDQDHDVEKHYRMHDELARYALEALWPRSIRGKIVADVGCGGGALLDHMRGLAGRVLAIEPARPWAESLEARGYSWFPSTADAAAEWGGKVDFVFSTQVIEHVDQPGVFLGEIAELLSEDGLAFISTPNRDDILMELIPESFPNFFYRVQHRWAFDGTSLKACADNAGLEVIEMRYMHRYGLSNALLWLKNGRPGGRETMGPVDATIDKHWQAWLESTGKADNICLICRRKPHAQ